MANKLKSNASSTGLGEARNRDNRPKKITTVATKTGTTYKVTPLSMRLSLSDKKAVNDWVEELQELCPRKVSPAKLMRALTALKDDIDENKLVSLINDMQ